MAAITLDYATPDESLRQHLSVFYDFRADVWERELKPDLGKAVRLQLFKGNEYRVCVAVAEHSDVLIEAHVLDINGENVEAAMDKHGWGVVLTARPKHTGVYIVTIRQAGGKPKPVTCAMIMAGDTASTADTSIVFCAVIAVIAQVP